MIILGLDASSTHVGYAVGNNDLFVESWQQAYAGDVEHRLFAISEEVRAAIERYGVEAVVVEHPVYVPGRADSFYVLGKVIGVIQLVAFRYVHHFIEVYPQEAKQALSGDAKATKSQMIQAARLQFVRRRPGEHQADAIGVWLAGWIKIRQRMTEGMSV